MNDGEIWVFGYGSLLWQPGFAHVERRIARLPGFHRSFCMRSIHHRGTEEAPGLVLALDRRPGAFCDGLAFRVAAGDGAAALAYLRARELVSSAYLEQAHEVALCGGGRVEAVCYVIDPDHAQYCGDLPLAEQAAIIARACGGRGPNDAYLYNTAAHLRELGIEDRELTRLETMVRALKAQK